MEKQVVNVKKLGFICFTPCTQECIANELSHRNVKWPQKITNAVPVDSGENTDTEVFKNQIILCRTAQIATDDQNNLVRPMDKEQDAVPIQRVGALFCSMENVGSGRSPSTKTIASLRLSLFHCPIVLFFCFVSQGFIYNRNILIKCADNLVS